MKDKDRIIKWINTILREVSNLDADKGVELLQACGRECSKVSALLEGAGKIKNEFKADADEQIIFQTFK